MRTGEPSASGVGNAVRRLTCKYVLRTARPAVRDQGRAASIATLKARADPRRGAPHERSTVVTWVKLSDTFAEDPRLEEAGPEALAVHVAGLCYCARQLTNGRIPLRAAHRLWSVDDVEAALSALVRVGLWRRLPDGAFEVADYLENQPSADTVRQQQALKRERQQRWRERTNRKGDASRSASGDPSRNRSQDTAPPRPAPQRAEVGRAPRPAGLAGSHCPNGKPIAVDGSCCGEPHVA